MNTPLPKSIGRPATSALKVRNITTLEGVTRLTEQELLSLHGVGPKAIKILLDVLTENNMQLRDTDHASISQ